MDRSQSGCLYFAFLPVHPGEGGPSVAMGRSESSLTCRAQGTPGTPPLIASQGQACRLSTLLPWALCEPNSTRYPRVPPELGWGSLCPQKGCPVC